MEVAYVRQDVANLRFGLYDRPFEPSAFSVLRQRSVNRVAYTAELWIIGSSHVLNLRAGGTGLAEVLTAAEDPLPSEGRLDLLEGLGDARPIRAEAGPFTYASELAQEQCSPDEFLRKESEFLADQCGERLAYRFPASDGLVAAPLTVVDVVTAQEDHFEIKTLHSYAEELTFVFTRSVVKLETR